MTRAFQSLLHAVNVVTHPHSRGKYEQLLRAMFELRRPIRLRGDRHALMTSLGWHTDSGEKVSAHGILSTFTQIDMDAPWLNVRTGKAANENETESISIPAALRPNLAQFFFLFDLRHHIALAQGLTRMPTAQGRFKNYAFGAYQLEAYFSSLASTEEVLKHFDRVDVTVVPDSESVSRILNEPRLRSLSLTIKPPNTDSLATVRGQVMSRLNDMGAKVKTETYTALPAKDLKPDDELRTLAKIAATNGRVDARVATEKGVIPVSTVGEPLVNRYVVDPDQDTERAAFDRAAAAVIEKVGSQT